MLYIIVIIISTIIIACVNIGINNLVIHSDWWFLLIAVVVSVAFEFAVDGLSAFIIRRLPEKHFKYNPTKTYNKKEQHFYEKLKIKAWKDKALELGGFTSFHKNKLADPSSNEYVERFILESNYGVTIHLVGIFIGFLSVLIFPFKFALFVGVPVAIVNAVLNFMSFAILRYNLPKLYVLHKRNDRVASKATSETKSIQENA